MLKLSMILSLLLMTLVSGCATGSTKILSAPDYIKVSDGTKIQDMNGSIYSVPEGAFYSVYAQKKVLRVD